MLKYIKENWLLAVISGATGGFITILLLFIFHIKSWSPDLTANWISAAGSVIGGVGAIGAMYLAYKAYKYATKQYMQNEIEKLKFEKRYNIINEILDNMSGYYKMFVELKSLYSILIFNIEKNNQSEIASLQQNIKQSERFVLEYRYKMVMESASVFAQLGKLEILGVEKKDINTLRDCITTYNNYTVEHAVVKQLDSTNLNVAKLIDDKAHYEQCTNNANLELTKIKEYILTNGFVIQTALDKHPHDQP